MKRRCQSPNSADFSRYGARGITVCERWNSFAAFLEDMGERPEGMSLDRIDNTAGYAPENCRWASASTQAKNRRPKRLVAYGGKDWIIDDLAAHLGIERECLVSRLKRHWPPERLGETTHFHRP
jgi:hypothetical protein